MTSLDDADVELLLCYTARPMFTDTTQSRDIPFFEFVALVALMSALVALAIDAMLPALPLIGQDLGAKTANDSQLIIGALFIGMASGPLFFGPMSDSFGRKPAVFLGLGIFVVGTVVSLFAESFNTMIVGRILQGFGASSPRIISVALIRDLYNGREMARVMSFISAVFIVAPAVAPGVGQVIINITHWRGIFVLLLVLAIVLIFWFGLRQRETLALEKRTKFSLRGILKSAAYTLVQREAMSCTVASGFLFGGFLGFLSSAQQIFQDVYLVGEKFALYFALLAVGFGAASLWNTRLVLKYGMEKMASLGIICLVTTSALLSLYNLTVAGVPPFTLFMLYALFAFITLSIAFANITTMAMDPLGKVAGIGSAIVSSLSTLVALPLGVFIGQSFNYTIQPLVAGFLVLGVLAWITLTWSRRPERKTV